ncbi:hypothetical protein BJ085DRAFT_35853 [Dimargaris cristalligena]|uniref:Uncharacterized protein n=1 Tax=Dimargaris cristalligena TaxID=215637 RepID=A0A4P9ZJ06_9FUNG|nr:hypothetical protein BJ085DRAFT_35853 [Dimargaris cristalligena]|eukprot:RKP33206.1 hypothetical protein BJ085DRAFT_35853 [Dimargaris cristalligena]
MSPPDPPPTEEIITLTKREYQELCKMATVVQALEEKVHTLSQPNLQAILPAYPHEPSIANPEFFDAPPVTLPWSLALTLV